MAGKKIETNAAASQSQPTELSPDEVTKLRDLLVQEKDRLLSKAAERRAEGIYEISRDDLADEADLASVETAQDVGMKLAEHDRNKLNLIDRALKKVEANDGSYGTCEATGEPIGYRRLEIQPWALYSLRHQEDLERQRRGG